MSQLLLILTMVFNLLACPLRCSFCEAGASQTETEVDGLARLRCSCCPKVNLDAALSEQKDAELRTTTVPGPNDRGNPAGEECTCPDCLCGGAILLECPELSESPSLLVEWLPVLSDDSLLSIGETWESHQHIPLANSVGRTALIEYQRWLI
ncbi:hypothetical protein [Roseiconus lacunae]|uniref:Secreted protein n=1 Tax=Roseiconus lacunae TaxID=2605694 RepID=A0ABT7PPQ5_9BACT|nr:hypothetical protein [Roseiconus lacunae]MDM4018296.1 hypothetical protein [Roseiconus lacunae]